MEMLLPIVAFGVIGVVAGILLTVASKIFEVKTDERLARLQESLPQINCGACGFTGCNDYAEAVLKGEKCNLCKAGGQETAEKLGEIMGVSAGEAEELRAFIRCGGGCKEASHKYTYDGIQSCKASNRFFNGSKNCTNGCLGYGDCVAVCPQKAICIVEGVAVVNESECIGCGLCVKTCPNNLVVLRPKKQKIDVRCSSTTLGKVTRTVCTKGCIGCRMCEKKCPFGAVAVENNVARIDYKKCKNCGLCKDVCKVGCITTKEV